MGLGIVGNLGRISGRKYLNQPNVMRIVGSVSNCRERGNANGRDRDRTDDLYRVKVARVIYLINLSLFSLHDPGPFLTVLGA